jgi:hypothetical protein
MADLTTSANQRLSASIRNRLNEDAGYNRSIAVQRIADNLRNQEHEESVAELTVILTSNGSAQDKLEQVWDFIVEKYGDEHSDEGDDEDTSTKVTLAPTTKDDSAYGAPTEVKPRASTSFHDYKI